jgi:hypothetical protein
MAAALSSERSQTPVPAFALHKAARAMIVIVVVKRRVSLFSRDDKTHLVWSLPLWSDDDLSYKRLVTKLSSTPAHPKCEVLRMESKATAQILRPLFLDVYFSIMKRRYAFVKNRLPPYRYPFSDSKTLAADRQGMLFWVPNFPLNFGAKTEGRGSVRLNC